MSRNVLFLISVTGNTREVESPACSIAAGKAGMLAYNYGGQFLQKINGTGLWLPIYADFKGKSVYTGFETGATVFIGCDWGLFKSDDSGKNWKRVY